MSPEETHQTELSFQCDAAGGVNWIVQSATLIEKISDPYLLSVRLRTPDTDAEPSQMLGQSCTLTIVRGSSLRQVTGIISEIQEGSTYSETVTATLTVEPALEALRHRANTRIYQEMTVPDILELVLNEGLSEYQRSVELRLSRTYPTCEYRTQYNESDLAFCHRLMQEEGIFYWFEFEGSEEKLVLADNAGEYGQIESIHDSLLLFSQQEGGAGGQEYVYELHALSQVLPTKVVTRHFDWTHPSVPIEGDSSTSDSGGGGDDRPNGARIDPEREIYQHDHYALTHHEYDGETYGSNDVDDQVSLRRELQASEAFLASGRSTVFGMTVGAVFEMLGHPQSDLDGRYLVLSVTHRFDAQGVNYENQFQCIPEGVPYRPKRTAPKPRVNSVQTATVVGPSGEEIHTDNHGRIKVQFHWDREGANDEHSSCWIRVMQPWAGAGWGFLFIPRIGMEVIVNFINGDPDLPMVMGSVYNGENPPPYTLPDEKTKSTIKTNSSLGGGGFNELRFEDKAGEEEIYTHAQKDYNEVVEHDHTTTVHHDQTNTVDNDQTQEIGQNQTEHVGASQTMTVDAARTVHVKGHFKETVDQGEERTITQGIQETITSGGEDRTITGGMTETITGDVTQNITGNYSQTVTGTLTRNITGDTTIITPMNVNITANTNVVMVGVAAINIVSNTTIQEVTPKKEHFEPNVFKYGIHSFKAYALNEAIRGIDLGIQYTKIRIGFTKLDAYTLKQDYAGMALSNEPVKITNTSIKTALGALFLGKRGVRIDA